MSRIILNKLKALGLSSGTRGCSVEDLKWTRYELNRLTEQLIINFDNLERQLAEARKLVFTAYQEGWDDNRNNLTHWIDSDSKYSLEQLKEKNLNIREDESLPLKVCPITKRVHDY